MEFGLWQLRVDGLSATRVIRSQPCSIRACSLARAFSAGRLDFVSKLVALRALLVCAGVPRSGRTPLFLLLPIFVLLS